MKFHDKRFPNESREYRDARNDLLGAEAALREQIESVAQRRRRLPLGGPVQEDYAFGTMMADGSMGAVKLSELCSTENRENRSLIIYSYMYGPKMDAPCPMCTSIIDALDAQSRHVTQRVNLVVVAKSPIARLASVARDRGWNQVRLLSSSTNRYNRDYWAEDADGNQMPMMNVFTKTDQGIYHFWGSELLYANAEGQPRHVDLVWPLWNLFDLTPAGRGTDWYPKLSYD